MNLARTAETLLSREQWRRRIVTPEVQALMRRMPKPVGSFGYDAWGYHEDAAAVALGLSRWLYRHYFHAQAQGLEHVPAQGRVLIVANHSGQLPIDGLLIGCALASNELGPRAPRAMIERFLPTVPWVGDLMTRIGAVIGDPHNCVKMLEQEEAIIVFPEGVRGSGKPYRQRYQLQRFGSGFMHLAMQTGTPIVPVGVVGCEETMPSFGNLAPLARVLGLPYLPMALPVPLPARVTLRFGEPLHFDNGAATEEEVTARVDQVKNAIAALLERGLAERTRIYQRPGA